MKRKVHCAKQRTSCRECGQKGHWAGDKSCPKNIFFRTIVTAIIEPEWRGDSGERCSFKYGNSTSGGVGKVCDAKVWEMKRETSQKPDNTPPASVPGGSDGPPPLERNGNGRTIPDGTDSESSGLPPLCSSSSSGPGVAAQNSSSPPCPTSDDETEVQMRIRAKLYGPQGRIRKHP